YYILALTVYHGDLIVGGYFSTFGGIPAGSIVRYDGSTWHSLGTGVSGAITSMIVVNDRLIVGGGFATAGGVSAVNVAQWNGSSWSAMGDGLDGGLNGYNPVQALMEFQGQVVATGDIIQSGTTALSNIAAWDGTAWQPIGDG